MTRHSVQILLLTALSTVATQALADCAERKTAVSAQLAAGNPSAAEALINDIGRARDCRSQDARDVRLIYAEWLLAQATRTKGPAAEALVDRAVDQHVLWTAAFAKGDLHFARRDYPAANQAYKTALVMLQTEEDQATTTAVMTSKPFKLLLQRAQETEHLAVASSSERDAGPARSLNDGDRALLGLSLDRGAEVVRAPIPILFEYDKDEFSPKGLAAAERLVTILRDAQPSRITVVGHTDAIGSDAYNQILSEKRARRVAQFLKSSGIAGTITALGRGKTEPRQLSDPSVYDAPQINELNRRVEFSWGP